VICCVLNKYLFSIEMIRRTAGDMMQNQSRKIIILSGSRVDRQSGFSHLGLVSVIRACDQGRSTAITIDGLTFSSFLTYKYYMAKAGAALTSIDIPSSYSSSSESPATSLLAASAASNSSCNARSSFSLTARAASFTLI
jgi:hypothetical protein